MAKKNNNGVENKNKNNDGDEKKKEDGPSTSKTVKSVKYFQGAESVKSECQGNKLTVVGNPTKLRDELATKTKNKVDLVSPQHKKDNKVNKDDANDTNKKQPEKTDDDEKPKKSAVMRVILKLDCLCDKCKAKLLEVSADIPGCDSIALDRKNKSMTVTSSLDVQTLAERLREKLNDRHDGNDSNGGGGDEKKKEKDEGNGGGKMKNPAGQSPSGQFPYGMGCRHSYGYQNGALETGEKMLLLCCEVIG